MRFWVAVTDNNWYRFLADRQPDEVNFWQPSGKAPFKSLPRATPFLFKLKRPHNHIAGLGFFLHFSVFPLSLVWEAFGERNGQADKGQLLDLLTRLRHTGVERDPGIGCSILANPIFFPRSMWIEAPSDWSSNIVIGKTYDTESYSGKRLWTLVQERLVALRYMEEGSEQVGGTREDSARYGSDRLIRPRLGQGCFRLMVTDAYQRRCAITGEKTLPVLEAAHIRPFSEEGLNATSNGLLLRSDFHRLFDRGLITVTPTLDIEVSRLIEEEWFNGKAYYRLHGKRLAVIPSHESDRPQRALLAWHNENVFTPS